MDNRNNNGDADTHSAATTGDEANNNDNNNVNSPNLDSLIAALNAIPDDQNVPNCGADRKKTGIDRDLAWRTREVTHTRHKNKVVQVPGVVAENNANCGADRKKTGIDRDLAWRTREVTHTRHKNNLVQVPGVVAENNAEALAGGLLSDVVHEEGEDSTISQQPPDHYKDLIHDVRVRRADGMAERIQHAQYRADAARLRNKCSLENEEKVAEDDGSFSAPGTVEFVRNGSEVSHGCITFSMNDHKESLLILSYTNCRVAISRQGLYQKKK